MSILSLMIFSLLVLSISSNNSLRGDIYKTINSPISRLYDNNNYITDQLPQPIDTTIPKVVKPKFIYDTMYDSIYDSYDSIYDSYDSIYDSYNPEVHNAYENVFDIEEKLLHQIYIILSNSDNRDPIKRIEEVLLKSEINCQRILAEFIYKLYFTI